MKRIVLLPLIMVESLQLSIGKNQKDIVADTLSVMSFTDS